MATGLVENSPSLTPNRARYSSLSAQSPRQDRCDRRRAIRLPVSLRRMPEPQADENAAPRSRLFPPAKRLPAHESLLHLQCSRGLAGSEMRLDLPTATGSTNQTGAG